MALYIDDVQIDPRKLAAMVGIDEKKYERIIKKPTFQLDKSRILRKKTINSPLAKKATFGIITSFWFKNEGIMKRLRYAEAQIPRVEGGVMRYQYEPGRLNVEGTLVNFQNAPDKAFYMFLNPGNPTSPFADKLKKKFAYMDTVEKTLRDAADMSDIQKALAHASEMNEEELVIVAKGLKILKSNDYDIVALRLQLQQYAINPVTNKSYVKAMTDEMVRIEGRIRNMIDNGIFKIEKRGSTRQWVWAQGAREGEHIGEALMNPNEDAVQRLITHIKANLGDFLYDLRNSTNILQADRKAREVLAAETTPIVDVPAHLASVNTDMPVANTDMPAGLSLKERVTTFAEFRDLVGEKGYPKDNKKVKIFMEAVTEGSVDDSNVNAFLSKLFEKQSEKV